MATNLIPNVKHVIAVASGKGGVGKSTVSANLALALAGNGSKVAIMDADVYGPSIPTILGITEKPKSVDGRILPVEKFGLKIISMGFFIAANEAVIWRGPMLHKMVNDFLNIVDWGELDYLIIDLPPGTGDIQLSLCQTISLTGAVIVSTPQDVAWNVAQKAIVMFDKLNTPVLGIVENMSRYTCSQCGHGEEIFGHGGAKRAAQVLEIPFFGEIPLETSLRKASDEGAPIVLSKPDSAASLAFFHIVDHLKSEINRQSSQSSKIVPKKVGAAGQPEILIEWNDGSLGVYPSRELRLACPCATCVDEWSGQKIIDSKNVPSDIRPVALNSIGRYALQVQWSDGHATGLYSFEFLRKFSPKSISKTS